ncbi:hypothetical protein AB0H77_07445 [Streptomyces sp. NPDC050844]|uniref:hypothetical protein n=1 Tax=Streptomyces sp. NPDC050844 TaxID=3155790 RepID=UPI0033DAECCB
MATAPIDCVQSSGQADLKVCPASVLRQTPPLAAAAYSVSARFGSRARETMRPPMFVGPTDFHRPPVAGS